MGRTWSRANGARVVHTVVVPKSGASETLGVRGAEGKGTSERSDGGSVKGTCEIEELEGLLRRWLDDVACGSDCLGPRHAAKRGNDGAESRTNGNGWEPDASGRRSLRKGWPTLRDFLGAITRAGVDGPRWECTEHGPSCLRIADVWSIRIVVEICQAVGSS